MYNVKDYGAKGDGITDDTKAIQYALDVAVSGGGKVYFPNGGYNVTNTLNVGAYVELWGEGQYGARIMYNSKTGSCINFLQNANLSGIRFLAIEAVVENTDTASALVYAPNVFQFTLESCYISGSFGTQPANAQCCVRVSGTTVHVVNCNMQGAKIALLDLSNRNDYFIEGCTLQAGLTSAHPIRVVDVAGGAVWITDCAFLSGQSCVFRNCSFMTIKGAYFDSAEQAVEVSTKCNHVYFDGCEFANRPGSGLAISNSANIRVNNSMVINCGYNGIEVYSGCTGFAVTNSVIDGNNTTNKNDGWGVVIGGGVSDFQIIGNRIGNFTDSFNGSQYIGVAINIGTSDRYVITNNVVTKNKYDQIVDNGSGKNKVVENNVVGS